jgi:hypothetical protein
MAIEYPNYVETPTKCLIKELNNSIASRKNLSAKLKNGYDNSVLFILMNPSKANEYESDRTINKCASIAFNDLKQLKIGRFSIVNVYPFYESNSTKLNEVLIKVNKYSRTFGYQELLDNLKVIQNEIKHSDYIVIGTGGIPKTISNQEEYEFILNTIISYAESYKGKVYLGSSEKYNDRFVYKGKYSYHICPNGNPNTIDKIKLHKIRNGIFIEIPGVKEIPIII